MIHESGETDQNTVVMYRLTTILFVSLAFLSALIVAELRAVPGSPIQPENVQLPVAASGPELTDPYRLSVPVLASLNETTARPLFSESRRSGEIASVPMEVAPPVSGPGPSFFISAIVLTDNERAVLVTRPGTGDLVRIREGESIAGWTLQEVAADHAVFRKGDESQRVTLRTFGPPPPARTLPGSASGGVPSPSTSNAEPRRPRRETRRESAASIPQPGQ